MGRSFCLRLREEYVDFGTLCSLTWALAAFWCIDEKRKLLFTLDPQGRYLPVDISKVFILPLSVLYACLRREPYLFSCHSHYNDEWSHFMNPCDPSRVLPRPIESAHCPLDRASAVVDYFGGNPVDRRPLIDTASALIEEWRHRM